MTKHIAIYARCSSRSQNTESQKPDLESWIEGHHEAEKRVGYNPTPVVWYEDTYSGRTMERPGWRKLEEALLARQVDRIVVWRLDRLGRTCVEMVQLFDELIALSVPLVSLKENIDLSTSAGRLMANVIASFAQWETEVRKERQMAGIARAKAAGKRWGGLKPGRRVPEHKVQAVLELDRKGVSRSQIAKAVGLARSTVYVLLEQENGSTARQQPAQPSPPAPAPLQPGGGAA